MNVDPRIAKWIGFRVVHVTFATREGFVHVATCPLTDHIRVSSRWMYADRLGSPAKKPTHLMSLQWKLAS